MAHPSFLPVPPPRGLYRLGRQATARVPGLRGHAVRTLLLFYPLYLPLALALSALVWLTLPAPASAEVAAFFEREGFWWGFWSVVLTGWDWAFMALALAGAQLWALVLVWATFGPWQRYLAARESAWVRKRNNMALEPGGFGAWRRGAWPALAEKLPLALVSLLALLLGLIPLVGPLAMALLNGHLLGLLVRAPYLDWLASRREETGRLKGGGAFWPLKTGLLLVGAASVPLAGLLALPWLAQTLALGHGWAMEQARPAEDGPLTGGADQPLAPVFY